MALSFDGVNDNVDFGTNIDLESLAAISVSIWIYQANITQDHQIFEFGSGTGSDGFFTFYFDDVGSISGRTDTFKISVQETTGAGGTVVSKEMSTGAGLNVTWQHVVLTILTNDASGVNFWVDGAEDAQSPFATTNVDNWGNTAGKLILGETPGGGRDRNGYLAECGVWNRVITDAEIVILSKAYSPLFLPRGLIFYAPLIGRNSPETDIKGGLTGTVTGAVAIAHPRIIYPSPPQIRRFTTAVGEAVFLSRLNLLGVG